MKTVVIIGGGAAGMFAAYACAKRGNKTILIEKNEKLGKKIYITGKGRCNLSNDCSIEEFENNIVTNAKFALSSLYALSPSDTYNFFVDNGLMLKIERGNRVFPLSDKASDVTKTLEKLLINSGVNIFLNEKAENIIIENGQVCGIKTSKRKIDCDSVIVCTGGISYSKTGSDGDGLKFAKNAGHSIITPKPSLCGVELKGSDFLQLQGLSLKNVQLTCYLKEKVLYTDFGEMLFTHFGVSGPIVLSSSAILNKYCGEKIIISIDLKPALTEEQLEKRFIREFSSLGNKNIGSYMRSVVPSTLIDLVLKRANVKKQTQCALITKEQRLNIIKILKKLDFEFKKLRPIEEAIVTSGGIKVKEINPKTLQSKLVKGLFFAGEVLDVDCFTGGFNLQFAFSSGYLAGTNA